MKKNARNYFRLLRPRQWIKNFAIFASLLFTGQLFNFSHLSVTIAICYGFLILCGISSAIYVINDIVDVEKDRLHPFKRFRPLANHDIPLKNAVILAVLLASISLFAAYFLSPSFFIIILVYFLLQLSYSLYLKHIEIIDILILASGYILRVYSGELITQYHISVWLLLTTISLSLFLASGKRRSELSLVSRFKSEQIAAMRKSLSHYPERLLDVYISMFATSTFISYSLFTFLENDSSITIKNDLLLPQFLPSYLQRKWLMITILPVAYGLMRYLQKMYEKQEGESPERVLFTDRPLLLSIIIWGILVIIITYFRGSVY